jgi:hypothetical protein
MLHNHLAPPSGAAPYELRFAPLFHAGRGLAFPCDAAGRVDLDALSERARANYFAARCLTGRDYAVPVVLEAATARTLH